MDGRCVNCKFWGKADEYETGHSQGLGRCEYMPMLWNATEWRENEEGRVFKDRYKDTLAFVQDGSDYSANLYTRPDFGCVAYLKTES